MIKQPISIFLSEMILFLSTSNLVLTIIDLFLLKLLQIKIFLINFQKIRYGKTHRYWHFESDVECKFHFFGIKMRCIYFAHKSYANCYLWQNEVHNSGGWKPFSFSVKKKHPNLPGCDFTKNEIASTFTFYKQKK